MRLLHTSSYDLHEFVGSNIPEYAILSHTWEEEEVLFSDLRDRFSQFAAIRKKGWQKILGTCKRAKEDGLEWVWIDTCCINKESSAELSEAINSMFKYYRNAFVCYAYLSDYRIQKNGYPDQERGKAVFGKCRWFTRGWTLQELLAPADLVFFDAEWEDMGTRWGLMDIISKVTGIPATVLRDGDIKDISIAARMSWAADRQTSREEDRAYSLMGIFGVNIPPLYGEGGDRAFMRLQEEIIKYSSDQSIFAWSASFSDKPQRSGLLAKSPSVFKSSANVRVSKVANNKFPYSLTNRGLHIHLLMEPEQIVVPEPDLFLAHLDCEMQSTNERLGIYLRKMPDSENIYERWHPDWLLRLPLSLPWNFPFGSKVATKEIYVANVENLARSELGSKRRLFSHVDFLSTTKRITKDSLPKGLKPIATSSLNNRPPEMLPCHHTHTIETYDMCYRPNLTEQPIHVNFVFIYNLHDGLLCGTTVEPGTTEPSNNISSGRRVQDLISNPRDQLIIPFDENESLLVSIRKIQTSKKNDSDDRSCCLLKVGSIPSSWGPRENPSSTPSVELGSVSDEVISFGQTKTRPVTLLMDLGPHIDIISIGVFSTHIPNPPEWYHNTTLESMTEHYEMMIPDETNPSLVLFRVNFHNIPIFLLALEICDLQVRWYNIDDTTDLPSSELWGKLTSSKRLPRKIMVHQSSRFQVDEQVKGVWVRILVAESTTRTVTHNMLRMRLSFKKL